MILYKNRKQTHPLIKYIQNWQEFNAVARRLWNYFLLKTLGIIVLFMLFVFIFQYVV